jgi:hypothetical protein
MIIAPLFAGDTNINLMKLQHELYSEVSFWIVNKAREIYLSAGKIFDPLDPRVKTVEENKYYDHRTIQHAHDIIAAIYRQKNQSTQLDMFYLQSSSAKHHQEKYGYCKKDISEEVWEHSSTWNLFYMDMVVELCKNSDFVRNVMVATVLSPNSDEGYIAEKKVQEHILKLNEISLAEDGYHLKFPTPLYEHLDETGVDQN